MSESLLDLLAPYFGAETAASVQQAISELDAEKLEAADALLQQFEHDIRQLVFKRSREQEEQDALAFLNQMTDEQLQHLLKPLKVGVMAIVLAQLRPNRAAKLLYKLETDERKKVLAAMGNIERIPLDVYQHISRQLAARAGELRKMRYVRANGVDALVKVLDYLDEHEQEEAFDYLKTQDVALAEKVSRRFMTFNQLFSLPETKLRELVVNVDRETLAKSLVSIEPETVEKIIAALPEKLGEMVRASLEANTDLPEEQVSEARRALMRSVRSRQTRKSILT
ncbi:MAG: hypothetical protein D6743_17945 [Calditrichaeota bacterium]|nr:MAG: hypothetical protein D6743_17945 [Calditrichota bacterium]